MQTNETVDGSAGGKKRFFTSHAKSSAMVVSLAVHAVLLVVALSFVAVTVVTKDDLKFEAKQVVRPKMAMKKLQVPVKIKRKRPRPRLRQRIVVKQNLNRNMPDIRMPEISGIKGGLGAVGNGGLGGVAGVGFSMPEIELFGVKSKGEKIFIILDSTPEIMSDSLGGIVAFTIIKNEVLKIVSSLEGTTLFNVAVYDSGNASLVFPRMVPATTSNIEKTKDWLNPLNVVEEDMANNAYGLKTLGSGGIRVKGQLVLPPLQKDERWIRPALISMKQQADTIYLLTRGWGQQRYKVAVAREWSPAKWEKWDDYYQKGLELLKKENEERKKKGQPPRILAGQWTINAAYFPGIERPPESKWDYYTPQEISQVMNEIHGKWDAKTVQLKSGIKKSTHAYTFNVIHFVQEGADGGGSAKNFRKLVSYCGGRYKTLDGIDAIKSYIGAQPSN